MIAVCLVVKYDSTHCTGAGLLVFFFSQTLTVSMFSCFFFPNYFRVFSERLTWACVVYLSHLFGHKRPPFMVEHEKSHFILTCFSPSHVLDLPSCERALLSDVQYWSLLNWQNLRLRCGCVAVPEKWLIFDIISSFFAKFKNVVHRLEPGETPSDSASHQALNYVQRS